MYRLVFRFFPKRHFSRLMGVVAAVAWPGWLLQPCLGLYVRFFRIDMGQFQVPPEGFATFNAFFTRPVRPEARPIDDVPESLVSPVDGTVITCDPVSRGRMIQAKGIDYALEDLLGQSPGWEAYDGGQALTAYLSPRDYHRIHAPCAGSVVRHAYIPGDLWTVSPVGVRQVRGLFARNERVVSFIETAFGEVALVAVGATVVGGIRVVYNAMRSNRPGAVPFNETLATPHPLDKGAEWGRFEIGSTIILLLRPGEAAFAPLHPGDPLRMGEAIGAITPARPGEGA